jgi:TRAP-type transport system periplasmic protein
MRFNYAALRTPNETGERLMLMHRLLIAAAALLVGIVAIPGAPCAQAVMKLANATVNDVQHEWQKLFVAALSARVGDKIKAEIYPASQLGAIPRMAEGVSLGTIESFITPTSFVTNIDPRFQIFDVPGLFVSPEHVHAVIHDPAYRDHLETMFLDRGLRVIGAIYNSPTVVLFKKPAPTLAAMKGMKVRTFASPLQIEPMKSIGTIPVPLALTEVIPQLQSGGIDGLLAGMPILTAFKYYDVAKYVTDLNFAQIVSVDIVNENWFKSQSKELQDAIRAAGREAEQKAFPWGVENVKRSNADWAAHGGEIIALAPAEQTAMMASFVLLGTKIVEQNPAVKSEFDKLKALVDAKRPN